MKATLAKPKIVTRKGKPVSVVFPSAEAEALERDMESKSKEFVEKGAEVYGKV